MMHDELVEADVAAFCVYVVRRMTWREWFVGICGHPRCDRKPESTVMRSLNRAGWSWSVLAAALVVFGAVFPSAGEEDFAALVKRLQGEKAEFKQRHDKLLAERYDMADRAAMGVTMSKGKP